MLIRVSPSVFRYKTTLFYLLLSILLVSSILAHGRRQAEAVDYDSSPIHNNETLSSDASNYATTPILDENAQDRDEEIFLESMEDLHHVTYLSMLNYNITDDGLLDSSALISIGNAVGAHKQHQKTPPPALSQSEADNKIRLSLMLESFILHLRNGHLERVGLDDLKQMVENLNITHVYDRLRHYNPTDARKQKTNRLVSGVPYNASSVETAPAVGRSKAELNTAERCNYLLTLYKYELSRVQSSLSESGGLQVAEGASPELNQSPMSANESQAKGSIEREQSSTSQQNFEIKNSSQSEASDSESDTFNVRLRGLCKLVVDCLSADELVKVISGPWLDELSAQEDRPVAAQSASNSARGVTDKLIDEEPMEPIGYEQRFVRESSVGKNLDTAHRLDRLQAQLETTTTTRTLRDSLSKSIAKLCPLILFQLHDNEETCTFKREDRPSMLTVWGFATLFVTIICFCSLIGLSITPFIGGNQPDGSSIVGSSESTSSDSSEFEMMSERRLAENVAQIQYHKASLTLFEGLAVGSLVGSALFSLIPQAFELQERESNQSFLMKAFIIFSGIYLFFCSERIMRIILDTRQKQKRQMRHANQRSSNSIQALAAGTGTSGPMATPAVNAMLKFANGGNKDNNLSGNSVMGSHNCRNDPTTGVDTIVGGALKRNQINQLERAAAAAAAAAASAANLQQRSQQVHYTTIRDDKSSIKDIESTKQTAERATSEGANETTIRGKRDIIRRRWRTILVSRTANKARELSATGSRAVVGRQSEVWLAADEKQKRTNEEDDDELKGEEDVEEGDEGKEDGEGEKEKVEEDKDRDERGEERDEGEEAEERGRKMRMKKTKKKREKTEKKKEKHATCSKRTNSESDDNESAIPLSVSALSMASNLAACEDSNQRTQINKRLQTQQQEQQQQYYTQQQQQQQQRRRRRRRRRRSRSRSRRRSSACGLSLRHLREARESLGGVDGRAQLASIGAADDYSENDIGVVFGAFGGQSAKRGRVRERARDTMSGEARDRNLAERKQSDRRNKWRQSRLRQRRQSCARAEDIIMHNDNDDHEHSDGSRNGHVGGRTQRGRDDDSCSTDSRESSAVAESDLWLGAADDEDDLADIDLPLASAASFGSSPAPALSSTASSSSAPSSPSSAGSLLERSGRRRRRPPPLPHSSRRRGEPPADRYRARRPSRAGRPATSGGGGGGARVVAFKQQQVVGAPQLAHHSALAEPPLGQAPPENSAADATRSRPPMAPRAADWHLVAPCNESLTGYVGRDRNRYTPLGGGGGGGGGGDTPAVQYAQRDISTVAWMIVLGDGLHNFIDGISIGAAFSESILSGVSISVAVICEEFPHELGDFAVLVSSGMTVREALGYNFLSACTCYLGMAVGIVLGDVNDAASYVSALAAGVFLYIALVDMMGELSATLEETSRDSITRTLKLLLLQNLGIFVGISIIFVLSFIDF